MDDRVLTFVFPKRLLAIDCVAELKDKMPEGWTFRTVHDDEWKVSSPPPGGFDSMSESEFERAVISLTGPENEAAEGDIAAIAGRYSGRLDHV